MKVLILLPCLMLLSGFTNSGSIGNDPIITRHDVNKSDFVHLAERFANSLCHLNLPDCEGAIIADRWVISAAHCAVEIQNKLKAGMMHFMIINGNEIEVDKVIIHELFGQDEAYDIALLHLKHKPKGVLKAQIYPDQDEVGQVVYLVGKGDTGDGLAGVTGNDNKLRAATNKVEEATNFWLKWTFDNPEMQNENLTEYEGISGPGDSGGPAFILRGDAIYLAGISSGQSTKNSGGIEGLYGVREYYARVSQYQTWIKNNIGKRIYNKSARD